MNLLLRTLGALLLVLALVVMLALGTLAWLIGTPGGLNTAVHWGDRLAPGDLSVERTEGRLWDSAVLHGLRYEDPEAGLRVAVAQARLDWSARALLRERHLHVTRLGLEGVRIARAPTADPDPTPAPPREGPVTVPDIDLPVRLTLEELRVRDLTLALGDADVYLHEALLRACSDAQGTLHVETFELRGDDLAFSGAGQVTPRGAWPLEWHSAWQAQAEGRALQGELGASGDLDDLQIDARMQAPVAARLEAQLSLRGAAPAWRARLALEPLDTQDLDPDWPPLTLGGELRGGGGFERFELHLDLRGAEPTLGDYTLQGTLARRPGRWLLPALTLAPDGPARLRAEGYWADAQGPDRLRLHLGWEALSWPLQGEAPLVRSRRGEATVSGDLDAYRVSGGLHLDGADLPAGDWRFDARGDLERLEIERLAGEILDGRLQADGAVAWHDGLQWRARVLAERLAPGVQWEAAEGLSVNAALQARGDAERLELGGTVDAEHAAFGPWQARLAVQRAAQAWNLERLRLTQPGRRGELTVEGRWRDAPGPEQFALRAAWADLAWDPLALRSPRGEAHLGGVPEAYRYVVDLELDGDDIPGGRWRAEGTGDHQALQVATLHGRTLGGELSGRGRASWAPRVDWEFALEAAHIDPGVQWPEWRGDLNLTLQSRGHLGEDGPHANVSLDSRPSRLRGYALATEARVSLAGERIAVERFALDAEDAQVRLSGRVDERYDLDWQVRAPDLAALLPEAAGRFEAEGKLHGERAQPAVYFTLAGERLALQDTRIARLRARAEVDLAGGAPSRLDAQLHEVEAGGQRWERIALEGGGVPQAHTLRATIEEERYSLATTLAGGYADALWTGELRDTRLRAAPLPNWVQRVPAPLRAGPDAARLEGLCLAAERDGGRLCITGDWRAGASPDAGDGPPRAMQAGLNAELTQVPFALLRPFLPPEIEVTGELGGHAALRLEDETLELDARLASTGGDLYYALDADDRLRVPFRDLAFTAATPGDDLELAFSVDLAEQDYLRGELRVVGAAAAPQDAARAPLQGGLRAELRVLELLPLFVPELSDTHGLLRAQATLGGTVAEPEAEGEVHLEEGRAHVLASAVTLRDINLSLAGAGREWGLSGSLRSGPGTLTLGGEFELANPWRAVLRIEGERFEAANMPEAYVLVTPELSIVISPGAVAVEGSVTIPEARLEPRDLGGAVTPTQDVVVLRGEEHAPVEATAWRVTSRLRLVLGERVQFEGFGLSAGIRGALRLVDEPGQVTTASGELSVVDGVYRAYGQNLRIDRGRLLFAVGQPLDNPGLDIRAVRVTREVTAGVTVRGTLQQPELALFSDPPMDQANALSYLLLGRPLGQASQSEGEVLYGAATALSLAGGERIAQSIGDALGIDEVRIEEAPEAADTGPSLVLGTYLSPRLYVNYSVGLFEPVNVLRVRYEITRRWMLQTETGGRHDGADLIYSIERGAPD